MPRRAAKPARSPGCARRRRLASRPPTVTAGRCASAELPTPTKEPTMRPPVLPVLATLLLAAALPHALRAQDADVPAQGAIQVHPVRHVSAQELENVLRNFLREDLQAQQVARAGQTG